jgi:hypothetical protein
MEEWTVKIEQLKAKYSYILFFKNSMDSPTIHIANKRDKYTIEK